MDPHTILSRPNFHVSLPDVSPLWQIRPRLAYKNYLCNFFCARVGGFPAYDYYELSQGSSNLFAANGFPSAADSNNGCISLKSPCYGNPLLMLWTHFHLAMKPSLPPLTGSSSQDSFQIVRICLQTKGGFHLKRLPPKWKIFSRQNSTPPQTSSSV